jgi:hypothetical protein
MIYKKERINKQTLRSRVLLKELIVVQNMNKCPVCEET